MHFQEHPSIFKSTPPFLRNQWFLAKRAVLDLKKHFWAPNAPFWVPCSKPFINTSFWEVFWGPRTAKVQLFTQKAKIPRKNMNSRKKQLPSQKVRFPQNGGNLPKRYFFCFKNMLQMAVTTSFSPFGAQKHKNHIF